ncbi:MAG: nucleoside kinase [Spirochaetaceae bacterium]|nr:nucleoside kinase [Spirochaetaceae bacterium]
MKELTLHLPQNTICTVPFGTKARELLDFFEKKDSEIVAVKINNELCSLSQQLEINAQIEPIYLKTTEGSLVYRRTLCFILGAAAHRLFPQKRLLVGHSLGYGYYYTLETDSQITNDEILLLENEMRKLIAKDLPIEQSIVSYQEALELFENLNLPEARKQLRFKCPSKIILNNLDNFSDIYFHPLLDTTGIVKTFELLPYQKGFLLRFPTSKEPYQLTEFKDIPQLFQVYENYKNWGKLLQVTSAASLNELIYTKKIKDFINITETLQNKNLADIADKIKAKGSVKVVLIAGPSSSGKTTSSKKLAMQLQVLGYNPKLIELDSYYVNREFTPVDENGDFDYECLEALDVQGLNQDLLDLFAGKEIQLPSYNFVEGKRYYTGKKIQLQENDILIMEGIHGLNEKLTSQIPSELKFKIYLSALTQLNLDDHNRIATSDNRLIRRIVRDSQFRGKSAAETIAMWPSVQKGERLHIFPFQDKADVMFNTALDYELAILKLYATPLLQAVTPMEKEYSEACRLLQFLDNFIALSEKNVPTQSLLREFIGGSDFKY